MDTLNEFNETWGEYYAVGRSSSCILKVSDMMTGRNSEMGKTRTTVPRGSLKICWSTTEESVIFLVCSMELMWRLRKLIII